MDKKGGGGIKIFGQNLYLSVPKSFVWEPFSVSLGSGIENFIA